MIASCVFSKIAQSSFGKVMRFFDLYDFLYDLKLTVHPVYSKFSRIFATDRELHNSESFLIFVAVGNPFLRQ